MRLPYWLRKNLNAGHKVHSLKTQLRGGRLHTVCEEARCPNLGECFLRGTAAFMIMGNICTRHCGFCAVKNGQPYELDPKEPQSVANQVFDMKLDHVVVTSVTRDDLDDGGAGHFAQTIHEVRKVRPETTIEVLTPDFKGRQKDIKTVCDAQPDIFNHNIETVKRLTPLVRNKASYARSLEVLRIAKQILHDKKTPSLCKRRKSGVDLPPQPLLTKEGARSTLFDKGEGLIKSGLMVGLGETEREVIKTLRDLKDAGCNIVTIGQYLSPSKLALPVTKYLDPEQFEKYRLIGEEIGIKYMFCGPFVRSSYMADVILKRKEQ